MEKRLLSVLTTCFNREDYLPLAIESVLSSTFTDFEYIIVDDGSADGTFEVAKSYEKKDDRIKAFTNGKNLGDYINRNKAASYATGKYIKYLDSDDIMYKHCLDAMVSSMEKFPEAGFGLSAVCENERPYPVCLSPVETYLEHFNGFGHFYRSPGSAIIKREAFEKVGGFSGKRWIGDSELWIKLGRIFPLVKFPKDLYWDRQHVQQEREIEVSKKNIRISTNMRKEMFKQMLRDPLCPLSEEQKQTILKNLQKQTIKRKLKKLFYV